MKKTSNLIIILSTILIVIGVIVGSVLTQYASQISTVVTTITAVIGAVALWIQFKKDRSINQSSFVIEFHKSFSENFDIQVVIEQLDNRFDGKEYIPLKDIQKEVISYLYWIKSLCNLIERNVFDYATIDDLLSYRFFSIVDNKEVQDMELVRYPFIYKQIYRVHRKWTEYRKKRGLINDVYNDEDLSLVPNYAQLSK